ncbi:Immunity protein YqcF [Trichinella spiralis]|uniref:Immunity protein YqcF n=1 Tax=Trichinella spiralis TaxID=6334 RepID=A0ABR3KW42_TRISP
MKPDKVRLSLACDSTTSWKHGLNRSSERPLSSSGFVVRNLERKEGSRTMRKQRENLKNDFTTTTEAAKEWYASLISSSDFNLINWHQTVDKKAKFYKSFDRYLQEKSLKSYSSSEFF